MKQYKNWKKLLVSVLVLVFAMTASLQASEDVSKDATEAEEEIILDETGSVEAASAESAAPAAEISSQEPFIEEITEIPTGSVPEVISADPVTEVNGQGEPQASSKTIEFYLDWNGIDGLFGHCLTCTREYKADGTKPKFTAEDAAVYGLNFKHEYDAEFDTKSPEEKWQFLKEKWSQETPYGYTFLGWSTKPTGGELITSDTDIVEGMSFYAYWVKGDESNETFERIDPAAGPLEAIRIVAGAGTEFRSGTLHAGKHAKAGESFSLNLFYTPVRAEINDITWNVAVYGEVSLLDMFRPGQNAQVMTVKANGEERNAGGVTAKAEGSSLTITSMDDKEHTVLVSATAKGADGQEFTSLSDATLGFAHSWDEGNVTKVATCEEKGSVRYTCTVCQETKEKDIPALEHVYNKSKSVNVGDNEYYTVKTIVPATCTEEGENEYTYKCLRCGKTSKPERGKVPSLGGHIWSEEVAPASCNKDTVTKRCTREGCTAQEVSLVPAYHPELHEWVTTEIFHNTCMSDLIYERCSVCGETRSRTEAADNPDCHSYAYESSMRDDCYWVTYTFKCVYGCGATQVMMKKEEGHNWSGWTTSASLDKVTGAMRRVRTRTCNRCGKVETEDLGSIAGEPEVSTQVQAKNVTADGNNAPASQSVNYAVGSAAAATVASPASSSTGNSGKTGWQKIGKKKYYLDQNGKKKTGWQKIGGKKYYFGKNGVMKTNWQTIKGKKYYFGKDGVMRTNWQTIKGKKYYFGKNGVMRTGKQKIGKKTYKFGKNGVLK